MKRWLRLAARPVLLLAGLIVAGLLLRRLGLDSLVTRAGEDGPVVFVLLGAVSTALGVPRQVVAYAGGLAFGFWSGALLSLLAVTLGCVADFFWARLVARRFVSDWLARGGRVARLERFLVANTFGATLTLRLLPIGNNTALNLIAGVSGAEAGKFLLASVIGYVPQTVIFALLGGGTRVSEGLQMGLAAGLMAASIVLGVALMRRRPVPQA